MDLPRGGPHEEDHSHSCDRRVHRHRRIGRYLHKFRQPCRVHRPAAHGCSENDQTVPPTATTACQPTVSSPTLTESVGVLPPAGVQPPAAATADRARVSRKPAPDRLGHLTDPRHRCTAAGRWWHRHGRRPPAFCRRASDLNSPRGPSGRTNADVLEHLVPTERLELSLTAT